MAQIIRANIDEDLIHLPYNVDWQDYNGIMDSISDFVSVIKEQIHIVDKYSNIEDRTLIIKNMMIYVCMHRSYLEKPSFIRFKEAIRNKMIEFYTNNEMDEAVCYYSCIFDEDICQG